MQSPEDTKEQEQRCTGNNSTTRDMRGGINGNGNVLVILIIVYKCISVFFNCSIIYVSWP